MGGYSGGDFNLSSCEAYVGGDRAWQDLPSMVHRRRAAAATVWRGCIVVVGGDGTNGKALASCEMYVPVSGRWVPLPPLTHARSGCAVVSMALNDDNRAGATTSTTQDCVVVLGGVDDDGNLVAEIEVLRCVSGSDDSGGGGGGESMAWETLCLMPEPRSHFGAVVVPSPQSGLTATAADHFGVGVDRDCILVVGGSCAREQFMRSVTLFDPHVCCRRKANCRADGVDGDGGIDRPAGLDEGGGVDGSEAGPDTGVAWREQPALRVPRAACTATVLDGNIYVCGGWPQHGYSLRSVEVLAVPELLPTGKSAGATVSAGTTSIQGVPSQSQGWTFGPPMSVARGACAAVAANL